MILRTHHFVHVGYGRGGLGVSLRLGLLLGLLTLTAGPDEVHCHCNGVNCVTRSSVIAENILSSAEVPNGHILRARQVKSNDNVRGPSGNHKPIEASNNSSSGDKFMEGGGNDSPKPSSDMKTSDKNTALPVRPTVDVKHQLVLDSSNTSVNQMPNEDLAKLPYNLNTAALLRGFYVFGGLGAMVVMYILVRTIRLRRKKTTVRRYGVLTNREDLEMTPLGADDDEDTTIFDLTPHTRT